MELINEQEIANNVYERWCSQYGSEYWKQDKQKMETKNKLKGVTDIDKINEIIGNTSWTHCPKCGECNKIKKEVLRIGEEPNCESSTAYICKECLIKAYLLINPIQWDKENIKYFISYCAVSPDMQKYRPDIESFYEWLKPFLESK